MATVSFSDGRRVPARCSPLASDDRQCALCISDNGHVAVLHRYSDSGPFIELFKPMGNNLIPALNYSISRGTFRNFNFASIQSLDRILCDARPMQTFSVFLHTRGRRTNIPFTKSLMKH